MEDGPTTPSNSEESVFKPLGDLTIFEAAQFHADLLALHRQEGRLLIDLSEVSSLDSSCVQLMVAATRSGRVSVQGYSSRIRDKFEQIGFGQFLPTQEC
ncbi:MAG: STAS domain-containing protein [Nitrospira sp.]|nr:STAS domain-containing protein [Nitrospira sp.]HNP27501.1 STAS domain-containing protein [Nitrospirales bacterium]